MAQHTWHDLSATEALSALQANEHGLSADDTARTVAVNALVVGEMAYLFNCRYLLAPVRNWRDFSGNPYVLLTIAVLVVIQLAFTYLPFMQKLFGVVALDAAAWMLILGFGVLLFLAVELEKLVIVRRRGSAG